ncbi:hypothetical protein ACH5RR_016423 [Cinchona calisaya]|uniref:Legume lectin domain-containing protein n=1 Tax=Cinchona calisaya TaxID=153742 RepID=A0ABD2ZVY4_9GENT
MHLGPIILVNILFSYFFLSVSDHHFVAFAINCGSFSSNSNGLDGHEWIGETAASILFLSDSKSRTSTILAKSFSAADPFPYKTSRIFTNPFHYTFQVSPVDIWPQNTFQKSQISLNMEYSY